MSDGNALVLAEIGLLRSIAEKIATKLGVDLAARDPFADINPVRLYTVAELVELRGGQPQVLYRAMKIDLVVTPTNGVKKVRGSDYIDWLQKRARAAG